MRIVHIRWLDSAGNAGWRSLADVEAELDASLECETVGFVIAEDDHSIIVAQSLGHENVDVSIQIPKVAVTSLEYLAAPTAAPSPLDVERLARALLVWAGNYPEFLDDARSTIAARRIAAEYASLSTEGEP